MLLLEQGFDDMQSYLAKSSPGYICGKHQERRLSVRTDGWCWDKMGHTTQWTASSVSWSAKHTELEHNIHGQQSTVFPQSDLSFDLCFTVASTEIVLE